ncbi:MAG: DUF3592 domain-containing protein [Pirellulaceae bacterium]
MDNKPVAHLILVVGGVALGFMPLLLFVAGITAAVHKRRALRTFVRVETIVLLQRLIEVKSDENDVWYKPDIEYEYEVRGVRYWSTNIWSGTSFASSDYSFSRSKAQLILEPYPVGNRVESFHDPEDPASAFLRRRHPSFFHEHGLTFLGGFGVFFLFGAAWAMDVFWQLSGAMLLTILCIVTWVWWKARKDKRE